MPGVRVKNEMTCVDCVVLINNLFDSSYRP